MPDSNHPVPDLAGLGASLPRRDLSRRGLLRSVAGLVAVGLPGVAWAQEGEAPLDPRLAADSVTFQVRRTIYKGLLVRPRVPAKRPGILLIPDQRGPAPHWRDMARRFAVEGFVVLLPDLVSPWGVPENSEEAGNRMARIIPAEHQLSLDTAAELLAKHPECNGSVAAVGFTWGGPYVMQFAIAGGRIKAGVVYNATLPSPEKSATAKVPLLFHWGENDPRTAPQIEPLEKKMIGAARVFESWNYPGKTGGFATDPGGRNYDKEAADRAFERTVFFLRRHLATGAGAPSGG